MQPGRWCCPRASWAVHRSRGWCRWRVQLPHPPLPLDDERSCAGVQPSWATGLRGQKAEAGCWFFERIGVPNTLIKLIDYQTGYHWNLSFVGYVFFDHGIEKLLLHCLPVHTMSFEGITDAELEDMGGNMMHLQTVGVAMLVAIALVDWAQPGSRCGRLPQEGNMVLAFHAVPSAPMPAARKKSLTAAEKKLERQLRERFGLKVGIKRRVKVDASRLKSQKKVKLPCLPLHKACLRGTRWAGWVLNSFSSNSEALWRFFLSAPAKNWGASRCSLNSLSHLLVHDLLLLAEVASLPHCYAKGLCIACRADVEVATRQAWKLDRFLWFRSALRSRSFQLQIGPAVNRLLDSS